MFWVVFAIVYIAGLFAAAELGSYILGTKPIYRGWWARRKARKLN